MKGYETSMDNAVSWLIGGWIIEILLYMNYGGAIWVEECFEESVSYLSSLKCNPHNI